MSALKRTAAMVFSLLALQAAVPAQAASVQIWSGWSWNDSGSVDFRGPVKFSYVNLTEYCEMWMSVWVSNGVATVVSASFTGSAACNASSIQAAPWGMTFGWYPGSTAPIPNAGFLTPPLNSVAFSGVRIALGAPFNLKCPSTQGTATMTAYMDQTSTPSLNNRLAFYSTLGPCRFETLSGNALEASRPVRVI